MVTHGTSYYSNYSMTSRTGYEVIRGRIHCKSLRIRLPAEAVRQPGWTRMEAAVRAVRDLVGLEVEHADRMQVIPVSDGNVIVEFMSYATPRRATEERPRVAVY